MKKQLRELISKAQKLNCELGNVLAEIKLDDTIYDGTYTVEGQDGENYTFKKMSDEYYNSYRRKHIDSMLTQTYNNASDLKIVLRLSEREDLSAEPFSGK